MSRVIEEMRRQERAEGRAEGIDESLLQSVRNLRQNTNWSITRAMDVLKVPEEKRERYQSILENW